MYVRDNLQLGMTVRCWLKSSWGSVKEFNIGIKHGFSCIKIS